MTFGLRCSRPACRPHPASLPVCVPAVESLPTASFSFASRLRLAVQLRLPSSAPIGSFHPIRSCPCWAHRAVSTLCRDPAAWFFQRPAALRTKNTAYHNTRPKRILGASASRRLNAHVPHRLLRRSHHRCIQEFDQRHHHFKTLADLRQQLRRRSHPRLERHKIQPLLVTQ